MSSYQVYSFDGVVLPLYNASSSLESGPVSSSLMMSAGGSFDWAAGRRRLPGSMQFSYQGEYAGEDKARIIEVAGNPIIASAGVYLVTHDYQADLRAQVDTLRAKIGVRGNLVRRRWDDLTVTQTKACRLLDVRERGEVDHRTIRAPLDLIFESAAVGWRSAAQSSKSVLVDALVEVLGNLPVRNASLTVTATTGGVTKVAVSAPARDISWSWTGTLASGSSLVVNAEAATVQIGAGVDSYSGFVLDASHEAENWLALEPGANLVYVTITGSASAATLTWYNVWS